MSGHGKDETTRLKKNLEDQRERLIQQLEDLDGCKDELDASDYEETKKDTMDQLKECNESLKRITSGNMTLINESGAMQLATQTAISAAFQTPAVIRMFGKREPKQLRERLADVDRDEKLGKLDKAASSRQKAEILSALKHLGEKLSPRELELLENHALNSIDTTDFVRVQDYAEKGKGALEIAGQQVRATQNT